MLPEKPMDYSASPINHMAHDTDDIEGAEVPDWKHWGPMVLCCLPMIAIAVLLIAGIWR